MNLISPTQKKQCIFEPKIGWLFEHNVKLNEKIPDWEYEIHVNEKLSENISDSILNGI